MTRVAVVGAGIMGCATAWALAERGADVALLEQHELGHTRGSSHGATRIFRLAYPEQHWVELAAEAIEGWHELERQAGEPLLDPYGLVELCANVEQTSRDALVARRVEHRLLDGDELSRRGIAAPEGWAALWQPDAGVVRAEAARRAFLRVAGVEPQEHRRVGSPDDLDADAVVVTAGAWVTELVPDVPVRVTRETVAYFHRAGPPIPSLVELDPRTRRHAMYALHDPRFGVKAGAHHAGRVADPNVDGPPDAALVERAAAWVAERLPGVDPEPAAAETCLYTTTADESFVLERRGRLVVGSACSGHGFKFAPAVGRRLAALALA